MVCVLCDLYCLYCVTCRMLKAFFNVHCVMYTVCCVCLHLSQDVRICMFVNLSARYLLQTRPVKKGTLKKLVALVRDLHILPRLPLLSSCFFSVYFENLRPSRSIFCFVCSHGLFISQSIRQPYANFDASHDHVSHF